MKCPLKFILFISLLVLSRVIFAQKGTVYTIQGNIYDSITNEVLIGVNVFFKDSQKGTVTNHNGFYAIEVMPGKYILVISYIGYQQKEIEITADRNQSINIFLVPEITHLEEVKITAQRKFFGNMEYGREIPSIDAEIIERQNVNNASDILHARLAGVWATKTSGAPSDHQKIRIRGQTSFFSSAEPLYVVDGVPVPIVNLSSLGIADLNTHDIENVTVLKDASATSLYGFQGGNGVVLIDTKQGNENQISFQTKFGFQWFDNFYDLMTSEEQLESLDSALSKMNFEQRYYYPDPSDTLCNEDWQNDIFSWGFLQEYQLSASGSKNKFRYYFSGNYTDHQGILPNSVYKRYILTSRFGRLFWSRLALDISYRGSMQENKNNQNEYLGNTLVWEGINKSPCLECTPDSLLYDEYNMLITRIFFPYYNLMSTRHPADITRQNFHDLTIGNNAISGQARLKISDHLSMDFMESFMLRQTDFNYALGDLQVKLKSNEEVILFNHQMNLSYYNNFKNHNIGIVLAHRLYKDNLWWQVDSLEGSIPDHYSLRNSMAAYGQKGSVVRNMTSCIGHFSYNYHNTYFISAIGNVSKIKEGLYTDYYSFFPSLALSWDIAREKPFRNSNRLDNFSLLFNYGISGNYPLNGFANDLYYETFYTYLDSTSYYPAVEQLANHFLKHERTIETDYGFKSSFFNHRLGFDMVYYNKKITDMILLRDIPYYYGGGKMFLNFGEVAVNGLDLTIEATPVQRHNFSWLMQFNFSKSKQRVTKLYDGEPMVFSDFDVLMPEFIIKENEPLGNIYGYKYLGKWTAEDDQNNSRQYIRSGRMKFLNADSSNTFLDIDDKVIIGNSIPDYTWSFINIIQYKNISLEMHWYATWGIEKYNATRAATYMAVTNKEINSFINDTLSGIQQAAFYGSSEFIDDAGFIRLKTLTIRYEPQKKILNRISMNFSLSFENLITITRYKGYDPEATIFTDNNFSDNAIDKGTYPNPKAVFISMHLKF